MVFCEELRRSVIMPRGLIAMTGCGSVVFQALTSSAHVLSDFAMLAMRLNRIASALRILAFPTWTVASSETTQILHHTQWKARRGRGRAFASPSTGEFFRTRVSQYY
jgi:hypothetical protein